MREFLEKIKSKKTDITLLSILLIIFVYLISIFWAHQGDPIIDCGKEPYLPWQILQGKVLFKDIFTPYGPLAYQLNALLFMIFGQNLNVLYGAGAINSLLILLTIYLIGKTITSSWVSWAITFVIMVICVFNHNISNYVFPYTYSMTYALSSFLISVLLGIHYIKNSREKLIPISFFFMGISLISKVEYSLFILVLLAM